MKRTLFLLTILMLFGATGCSASGAEDDTDGQKNWEPEREKATEYVKPTSVEYKVMDTTLGKIKGIQEDGYAVFKGVRYATAGRWEDAESITGWEGEYDATKYGDRCPQYKAFYGKHESAINQFYYNESLVHYPLTYSEDCLNLNIWTPDNVIDAPVLVFIHGGANLNGGNNEPFIDGAAYTSQGIILVSINYRLNAFTSIYGDGYKGNYALTDQITALKWVRENIKDYGGDPARITMMGESAGAVDIQDLLISPLAKDIVCGAIMMSGGGDISALSTPTVPAGVEPVWTKVKENLGVESISELKDMSAKDVFDNWRQAYAATPECKGTATKPMVNGDVLTMNVKDAVAAGIQQDIPCMIGVLSEDSFPYVLYNAAIGYGVDQSKAGNAPVYTYFFDRQLPGENKFGAYHAGDLWYTFGTLYRNWRPFDDIDYRISTNMIDYISNFVYTGDPNGEGLPEWTPVTEENQKSIRFGDDKPFMYAPSLDDLLETQKTQSPYPYVTPE